VLASAAVEPERHVRAGVLAFLATFAAEPERPVDFAALAAPLIGGTKKARAT